VTKILGGDPFIHNKLKTPNSIKDRRDAALRREGATKAITFDLTVGSCFIFLHEFSLVAFLRVAMKSLLGDEELWSARLE